VDDQEISMAVSNFVDDRVVPVTRCDLRVSPSVWEYARANAAAIDAAWRGAVLKNPQYFNGAVHLIEALAIGGDRLEAKLLRTDFKSYLYWRAAGFPETGVLDGFGSALLRSADGAFVLGRQRTGNVNGGLTYLPGGFIDDSDVDANGHIDICASIARELGEETGLTGADVRADAGFLITQAGAHVSIAVTYAACCDALALKAKVEHHIAGDPGSELAGAVIVRRPADIDGLPMPTYARALLSRLLAPDGTQLRQP
jgi:8-oxo-dGTP pyrophosphatase MutT (NUDIX family)